MNSYQIGWRRMESRMKNWRSLHYYSILKIYYTLYSIKLKICTQRFYYSSYKFSKFSHGKSSVAGLCLFAKGEVKNLSKVDWISLFFRMCLKVIQTLVFNQGTKSVHFSFVGMTLCSQRLKLLPVVQQTEKISSWNGPTVHVCCFMLARVSTKTFVNRVRKATEKIFVSRKIH